MLVLNRSNYHSLLANQDYMSRGQYLDFLTCEAQALAKVKGEWIEEPSDALLVGQYVHTFNDGTRPEFISLHPEMFKKDGGLKAPFVVADKMIATLQADPFAMYVLEGQKEVIFTAELFGCWWKVMIDSHNIEKRRNVDLKTTRSITDHAWSEEIREKVSFVEKYNYMTQAALYSEIERIANSRPLEDWLDFYIVAVSKQDVPDKEVISMVDPERYKIELINIRSNMPRILAVKSGQAEPEHCGHCDYCRSQKQLTRAIHYSEL
ncbi:MAG: PD-(D/E)XK nuclease-like domain-containing protein [Bacillota bacterium]|nr:PD-(D/E)XK nuclease-like domain-containing protein [Bacillota bacterium]